MKEMNNKNKGRIAFLVLLFFCFNNSCLAVSEEDNGSLTWQKWHPAVAKYIDETTGLIADTGFVIANYMSKPIYLIFPPIKRKLFNNAKTEINEIGRRLKSLQPPLDLCGYHEKVLKTWTQVNDFFAIRANHSRSELKEAGRQYLVSQIEIVEEIKTLFVKHKAPSDYIENQHVLIRDLRKSLNRY